MGLLPLHLRKILACQIDSLSLYYKKHLITQQSVVIIIVSYACEKINKILLPAKSFDHA